MATRDTETQRFFEERLFSVSRVSVADPLCDLPFARAGSQVVKYSWWVTARWDSSSASLAPQYGCAVAGVDQLTFAARRRRARRR